MTTTLHSPEQRVVLDNITWEVYESLLLAHRDRSVPRFTYDRGRLEIVSPSIEHEQLTRTLDLLVSVVAEELCINVKGCGSTTFHRKDLDRGFEPNACFYIKNLGRIWGKKDLDLRVDPPPDIAIEIDITRSSVNKFSIMAEVGFPEVWRYDLNGWHILTLDDRDYTERTESVALPELTAEAITRLIEESRTLEPRAWPQRVRDWVRKERACKMLHLIG
jgi:Uma2 family endonuclease